MGNKISKMYKYKGKTVSMRFIAKSVSVPYGTVCSWLRAVEPDTDVTDIINKHLEPTGRRRLYKGEEVVARYLACLKNCTTESVYKLLVDVPNCCCVDDIIDDWDCHKRMYYYNGKLLSIREICEICDPSGRSSLYHILKGVDVNTDVTELVNNRRRQSRKFKYNGKITDIQELSELTGYTVGTIYMKLRNVGNLQDVTDLLKRKYRIRNRKPNL